MEQPQQIKTISAVVIIFLVLAAGFLLFAKYRTSLNQENSPTSDSANDESATVVVENTSIVNGVTPAPRGFPQDIPLESGNLTESATTQYPRENARQLSVSYLSSKTIAQKYAEYKTYMSQAGYSLTEGNATASVRAIFGVKEDSNLSVAISSSKGKTLIQLSYLLKSVQ